ncbi:hypothetical protein BS50DRAFT_641637 [Corynespora cassiicola Philippines]|uniref:Uncharacterized protein n=1 Tax=Corynespora cassiicola Philippines TaxID=1448308 RepID=A0A2T2MZD2_CORCC|nr:hypothetical protein BS50DRAFT_641637 [Corynespora cassiicola Philippines]
METNPFISQKSAENGFNRFHNNKFAIETRESSEQVDLRKRDAIFTSSSDTPDSYGEDWQLEKSEYFLLIFYEIKEALKWPKESAVQEWGYHRLYEARGWCEKVFVWYDREWEQKAVKKFEWGNICPEVHALDEEVFRKQMNAARKDSATWTCSEVAA